jgi:two-component system, cell cycle sensor histidine kinase and response regulator CckA
MEESSIRILLIEDNPGDARLVKEMLAEGDPGSFHLSQAERLSEGLRRLKEEDFQVVLLDLSLPDAQGLDTVSRVCAQAPHVPALVLTGLDDETLAIRAVQEGAQDYLVKGQMDHHLLKKSIRYGIERKRAEEGMRILEEQLRQLQKMEAIGQLAGGVAHDFNNLLTIIRGYIELSLSGLKEGDPLKGNLDEAFQAAERAANLTRQLLAFSRRQMMEMKLLDLNLLLSDLQKMLCRIIGEDIELVTFLEKDLGGIKADPGQIEQVILNLAINSRDAMKQGGKLTIETANVELDEKYARNHISVKPGRYVLLAVTDTGIGMTVEVKKQVFEPFFTTKEQGRGTGLGLAMAYGIVKQSGGNIWAYSEPGQGTTFKVYLPRVNESLDELRESRPEEKLSGGTETILVVEDEEALRKFSALVLRKQGYRVLESPHGNDAFHACRQYREPIHVLLTDVVMPGMSGPELAERLVAIHPETKVLYMSGYADNAIVRHGILDKKTDFLQKPFTMERLTTKVREVLDKDLQANETTC